MVAFVSAGPPRFRHQRRGLATMIRTQGVTALLMDPGLGKTAVVVDFGCLLALKSPRQEARVLVVCPLVAVDTWVAQVVKFASPQVHFWAEALGGSLLERAEALAARGGQPFGGLRAVRSATAQESRRGWRRTSAPRALHYRRSQALAWRASPERPREMTASEGPDGLGSDRPRLVLEVVNIDTLASRARYKSQTMADHMVDAIRRYGPDLVVVDESHKIKSYDGNASRLMGRVAHFVPRRVILTGTVMPHSPLDVWAQWRFLDPYAFGSIDPVDGSRKQSTWGEFKDRYAVYGGFMGQQVVSFRNLDHMQQVMARNSIVVRKAEALDLPRTTDVLIPVDLSPAEKKAYADLKNSLATQLARGTWSTALNRLTQMLRLRQITSGHLPDDLGRVHQIGSSKVNTIRSIVNDTLAGERRVVVFCLFIYEIEALSRALARTGTEVMVITGATPPQDRAELRRRFGSTSPDRMVMVAQVKTMSLAVNELVTASHAVFGSLSQQRDDLIQARDRLDRIGQTSPVTFWYAVAPGTVDEVILQSHQDRTDLENAMLRHIQADQAADQTADAAPDPDPGEETDHDDTAAAGPAEAG